MININGKIYNGNRVSISNNKIIIDGVDQTPDSKVINIEITANVEKLQVDHANRISVKGDVGSISTQSGDVDISGNVAGSVSTMSGDVDCGTIGGSASTMSGDIKHRKN